MELMVTRIQQVQKDLIQSGTKWMKTLDTFHPKRLISKFEKHSDTNEIDREKPPNIRSKHNRKKAS